MSGDLPFTEYLVMYDNSDFTYLTPVSTSLTTSFTLPITNPALTGQYFRFRVATSNSLGTSDYSDEI